MYNTFFGFREKPFKLVPNPDYLFLSKSHEVALAHLNYATDQGDGFVVITGEVGTGKTTLCRNYLEQLGDKTRSAYIFNPKLDSVELLTAICHEYGIETEEEPVTKGLLVKHLRMSEDTLIETSKEPTTKDLLDKLYLYLMEQNRSGHKVVLLIDEAQALNVDNLEMVRMISNLETTRTKLLQIILVGQPELGDLLDTHQLRQLAQRISLNCYLTPLTEKETFAYMQHRVNIAAQKKSDIFTADAAREIHQYAAGIPRLINIACDRALLAAYSKNSTKVSANMVKKVVAELSTHIRVEEPIPQRIKPIYLWGPLAAALLIAAVFLVFQMGLHKRFSASAQQPDGEAASATPQRTVQSYKVYPVAPAPATQKTKPKPATPEKVTPARETTQPQAKAVRQKAQTRSAFAETLRSLDSKTSRFNALALMLSRWGQAQPNPDVIPANMEENQFFQIAARQYGLRAYMMPLDWSMIKRIDLPTVLAFHHPDTMQPVYLALVALNGDRMVLADGGLGREIETDIATLETHAKGTAFIYWKNTLGYDAVIGEGAHTRAVMVVKTLLRKVGYDQIPTTEAFDQTTRAAIRDFQRQHTIKVDGLVGPLTKIFLIQQANAFDLPVLNQQREAGA